MIGIVATGAARGTVRAWAGCPRGRLSGFVPALSIAAFLVLWGGVGRAALTLGPVQPLSHDVALSVSPENRRFAVTDRVRVPFGEPRYVFLPEAWTIDVAADAESGRALEPVMQGGWRRFTLTPGRGYDFTLHGVLPPLDPDRGALLGAGEEGALFPVGGGWMPDEGGDGVPPLWKLSVSVSGAFIAVATGALEGEDIRENGYSGRFAEMRTIEAPSVFVGPWRIEERVVDGVRLRAYLHPEQAGLAEGLLETAAEAVSSYSASIGTYPFRGFSVVSAPLPVGLGFPGLTYIGRQVLPLPFIRGRSLVHEVLHNWWGNGVRVAPGGGNWAEGLTTYLADHAMAEREGADTAASIRLDWLRDFAALPADRDMPLRAFKGRRHDAEQVVGYGKSAMLFHMLRRELGDETFAKGIRLFWRDHRFGAASWDDLRRAFDDASGRSWAGFFAQWLDRPGAPTLSLKVEGDGGEQRISIAQGSPSWRLSIPVVVDDADGGTHRRVVEFREFDTEMSLKVPAGATRLRVDPDHDVFRRLESGETALILRDFTLRRRVPVMVVGDAATRAAAARVAERLFGEEGMIVQSDAAAAVGNEPLAVIGGMDSVAAATRALGVRATLPGAARRATGRMWTARGRSGGPVLVVEGADPEALNALGRPLPHYRRESWVLFNGVSVLGYGVWPVDDKALTHLFDGGAR